MLSADVVVQCLDIVGFNNLRAGKFLERGIVLPYYPQFDQKHALFRGSLPFGVRSAQRRNH